MTPLILTAATCKKKEEAPVAIEEKPAPRPIDPAIAACKDQFAGIQGLGSEIDVPAVWEKCMVATGRDSGMCDTTQMLHAEVAVCIAQANDMFATGQVLAHLEVNPNPGREVLFWSLSSTDNVEHAAVDASSGEMLARMRDGQDIGRRNLAPAPEEEDVVQPIEAKVVNDTASEASLDTAQDATATASPK